MLMKINFYEDTLTLIRLPNDETDIPDNDRTYPLAS